MCQKIHKNCAAHFANFSELLVLASNMRFLNSSKFVGFVQISNNLRKSNPVVI